jgi:DNA-binding response OmpR family regulator
MEAVIVGAKDGGGRMGRHVLLIEDEPNIVEAIRFILTRDGWHVSTHSDGADAVAVVQRLRPDVLILDVMLPGQSGLDVLRQLRALPDLAALRVMVLTAKGQGRDTAQSVGADVFMTKPFANADILAAVRGLGPSGDAP